MGDPGYSLQTTRKPIAQVDVTGLCALRAQDRQPAGCIIHMPPRTTRSTNGSLCVMALANCSGVCALVTRGGGETSGSAPPGSFSLYASAHHSETLPCMSRKPQALAAFLPTG